MDCILHNDRPHQKMSVFSPAHNLHFFKGSQPTMLYAEMVLIRGLFGDEETLTPSNNGSFQVDPSKRLIRFIFMVVLWFQKLNNHQTKDDAIMDIIYKVDSYIVRVWITSQVLKNFQDLPNA